MSVIVDPAFRSRSKFRTRAKRRNSALDSGRSQHHIQTTSDFCFRSQSPKPPSNAVYQTAWAGRRAHPPHPREYAMNNQHSKQADHTSHPDRHHSISIRHHSAPATQQSHGTEQRETRTRPMPAGVENPPRDAARWSSACGS